jgi:hydrogenase-4 component F
MPSSWLIIGLVAPWALAAALAAIVRPYRPFVGRAGAALGLVSVASACALWGRALSSEALLAGREDLFRVDALSALMAFCVSVVAALAMLAGPGLSRDDEDRPASGRFRLHGSLFVLSMLVAVTINNVALMWVAIEATTITSALLIPLHRTRASVEASWKYILIGSVGIALAFAGTVLAYFDFVSLLGRRADALNWTLLMNVAPSLHPEVLRLAFVFLVVGYGTKAGLAPMHTWLPDAHSEAPAPLSAMMSGVLLAVAQYAILRWKAVVDLAAGPVFSGEVLMALGLVSIGIGAMSLVPQRNYKRMLAYSSVEHSGLVTLGLAFGPAGVFASMLHLLNHALAKSSSFLLAGRVLRRYGSAESGEVTGLLRTMPGTGALFAAGVFALMGLPPFGLFVSEFLLFRAGFASGHVVVTSAALVLAGIGFVALASHLLRMLYGAPPADVAVGERQRWVLWPIALCVAGLVVLGLLLPAGVQALLDRIIGGLTV